MALIKDLLDKAANLSTASLLAMAGVFPHLMVAFAILDPAPAIGAWAPLGRKT